MICLLHLHCNLRYSEDLVCLQLVWKAQEYTHLGVYASVNIWRRFALRRSQYVTCHSEKKIQALKANNQLKRIPLNVGQGGTKDKTWMQTNPHFGRVKIVSSGGSLLLIISFLCRGWPQPSPLAWGGSAGRQKERRTQKNRLRSVIRQRNARKLVTSISITKKKKKRSRDTAMQHHEHIPQQWLWAFRWWNQDGCYNRAFLLLG